MKKVFFILLLLTGIGISLAYYYWQQATKLPEWYTNQSSTSPANQEFSHPSEIKDAETRLQAKIEASIANSQKATEESSLPLTAPSASPDNGSPLPGAINKSDKLNTKQQIFNRKNVEIELSNEEVNDLVMSTLVKQLKPHQAKANVPVLRTTIKEGIIESGTVVNLSEVSQNQLSERETALLQKMLKTFPVLENRKIYVGISGEPRIENGQLKLDNDPKVKLGNLSLSLSELSQRLNIPQEQLEQKLNRSLQLGRLKVNDMELKENRVLLRGSVTR